MCALITACPQCGATAYPDARFCASCGMSFTPGEGREDLLFARLREATQGEFDLVRPLGRGGMAAVFLAWDLRLARYVAIKVMLPDLDESDTMPQRFLQEARTAANLDDHPNIVRVYRAEERHGLRFFVMKFVDGCSLDQLLKAGGALPLDVACFVLEQIAEALDYAHGRGVIHRDVKPANVMLDRHGLVVVTDFGIAKVTQGVALTKTGFAIGTPAYMSPEQWTAEISSSAADQYALGVVGYQMLTGKLPFTGSAVELMQQHMSTPPRPIRELRPDCPPVLEATLMRMLAKHAADRWPTLGDAIPGLDSTVFGRASALRARLGALIPAVTGPESAIPPTPRSPVPVGRSAPRSGPAAPTTPLPPLTPVSLTPVPPAALPPSGLAPLAVAVAVEHTRLAVGARCKAVAQVIDESGEPLTGAEVVWSSASPEIATVSAKGEVTAVAPGRTRIIARHAKLTGDATLLVVAAPLPVATLVDKRAFAEPIDAPTAPEIAPRLDVPARGVPAARHTRRVVLLAAAAIVVIALAAALWRTVRGSTAPARPPIVNDFARARRDASTAPANTAAPVAAAAVAAATPARVEIQTPPDGTTVAAGDSVRLHAHVFDSAGAELNEPAAAWSVSDPKVARISGPWVVGLAPGNVELAATAGAVRAAHRLTVRPRGAGARPARPVASADSAAPPPLGSDVAENAANAIADAINRADFAGLSPLFARVPDGSALSDGFLSWLTTARYQVTSYSTANVSTSGAHASSDVNVKVRWTGAYGGRAREDEIQLRAAWRREANAWKVEALRLRSKFPP